MTSTMIADRTSCSITGARAKRLSGTCTTTFLPAAPSVRYLPAGWSLIDVADFNRDGNNDYALFNSSTRQTIIWYLSGNMVVGSAWGPIVPSGWPLVATGDFNGDGKPDYVLYNASRRKRLSGT